MVFSDHDISPDKADDSSQLKLDDLLLRYKESYKSLRSIAQVVLGSYY